MDPLQPDGWVDGNSWSVPVVKAETTRVACRGGVTTPEVKSAVERYLAARVMAG